MVPQLLPFNQIEISNILRWIEGNSYWPIQDIDSFDDRGYFITLGHIHPNDEFMVLEKRYFDYRWAIRGLFLGSEMIGWLVCGNELYPAIKIL